MTKFKCIVIDDEDSGRIVLKELLMQYCPDVLVIAEADNILSGYEKIQVLKPDFILLDIQMPGGSGFDLLKKFTRIDFDVIFVTSYDKYAINAIKFSALEYLLKPVEVSDLVTAIEKLRRKKNGTAEKQALLINLLNNIDGTSKEKKIAVHHQDKVRFITLSSVYYFEAESNYTHLVISSSEKYITARILIDFEDFLAGNSCFMRINKSVIVNLNFVSEYSKGEPCIIYMQDGKEFDISRRKKTELGDRLRN